MPFYESDFSSDTLYSARTHQSVESKHVHLVSQVAFYDRIYSAQGYAGQHQKKTIAGIWIELVDKGHFATTTNCLVSPFELGRLESHHSKTNTNLYTSSLIHNHTQSQQNSDYSIIATTRSTTDGWFSFDLTLHPYHCYQIRAVSDVQVRHPHAPTAHAQVTDHSDQAILYGMSRDFVLPLHPFDSNRRSIRPHTSLDTNSHSILLPHLTAPKESTMAGALNILHATIQGYELIQAYSQQEIPLLSYRWEKGVPVRCGSCYRDGEIFLGGQVEDPDHYDDHIILHEMGHYFIDYWSEDHSPGGPHRGRFVSPQLAYGEGVAYFWSALVLQDPLIVDWMLASPWVVDIEHGIFNGEDVVLGVEEDSINSRQHEELISTIMWDVYDEENEGEHDLLSIGLDLSMHLLLEKIPNRSLNIGPAGVDLSDWLNQLSCLVDFPLNDLEELITYSLYPWSAQSDQQCMKGELFPFLITTHDKQENKIKESPQIWMDINPHWVQSQRTYEGAIHGTLHPLHTPSSPNHRQNEQNLHVKVSWFLGEPPYHTKQDGSILCQKFPCALHDLFAQTPHIGEIDEVVIFEIIPVNHLSHPIPHSSSRLSSHMSKFYLSWLSASWYKHYRQQVGHIYETRVGKSYITTLPHTE